MALEGLWDSPKPLTDVCAYVAPAFDMTQEEALSGMDQAQRNLRRQWGVVNDGRVRRVAQSEHHECQG